MFYNCKLEHAQKRRVSQRSDGTKAGPSKFISCSVDTVSDINVICFFCERDVIGSDRNVMTKLTDCAKLLEDKR